MGPGGCKIVKLHFRWNPRQRTAQTLTYLNRNNSATDCSISLKFGLWVRYGPAKWLQFSYREIQGGRQPPNFQFLNRYNSAADRLLSLKFSTEFDHITAVILSQKRIGYEQVQT